MPTKNPTKAQRKYWERNRVSQVTERLLGYKIKRGVECELCGYNKNWAALVWHHREGNKEINISSYARQRRNWKRVEAEIEKCTLICHNCHAEWHYPHATVK